MVESCERPFPTETLQFLEKSLLVATFNSTIAPCNNHTPTS